MTVAVTRRELGAAELRREAGRCRDARAARRKAASAAAGGRAGSSPRSSHSAIATAPGRSRPPRRAVAVSGPGTGGRRAGPGSSAGLSPDLILLPRDLLSLGFHSMKPGPGRWNSATASVAARRGPTRGRHSS